jgi:hypothetical protein
MFDDASDGGDTLFRAYQCNSHDVNGLLDGKALRNRNFLAAVGNGSGVCMYGPRQSVTIVWVVCVWDGWQKQLACVMLFSVITAATKHVQIEMALQGFSLHIAWLTQ